MIRENLETDSIQTDDEQQGNGEKFLMSSKISILLWMITKISASFDKTDLYTIFSTKTTFTKVAVTLQNDRYMVPKISWVRPKRLFPKRSLFSRTVNIWLRFNRQFWST